MLTLDPALTKSPLIQPVATLRTKRNGLLLSEVFRLVDLAYRHADLTRSVDHVENDHAWRQVVYDHHVRNLLRRLPVIA